MKQNFDRCLQIVLHHEGGFVNHPKDPGGATNRGVTKKVYEQWVGRPVSIDEMKALTVEDVTPIYRKNYWDKVRGDDLPSGIDLMVFDFAVNAGPGRAIRTLQKLLNVKPDGVIGPITLGYVHNTHNPVFLISHYKIERMDFYYSLATYSTFGKGWAKRVEEVTKEALHLLG